ncbi:MAG: MFS transporter [Rhodanobacteraceae bacterium]|nr:MFS transporter [Rhodanobacteraceae bacterium]
MSTPNQFALLKERRFLPFFLTQALGAFNDNVFKHALIILITFLTVGLTDDKVHQYTNLAAALFILPFFLFSATSGQLADKYDKARLAQAVKLLEIAIMVVAAIGFMHSNISLLLATLFMMGLHSTLFGPLKYGILPQVLDDKELVGGNGLIEMATFLAILLGTLLGSTLIRIEGDRHVWVSVVAIVLAVLGLGTALMMPKAAPVDPGLKINWNPFSETWRNLQLLRGQRAVLLSCLGISWFWFFGSMYFTQLPSYTKQVLGGDPGVYTLLLALFSIGIGFGSMLCERLSGHKVEIGLVPFGAIGMTLFGADLYFAWPNPAGEQHLAIRAFLAQPAAWRVLFDLVGMAIFSGFFIVPLFALVQSRSDPKRRSRIIAANNILNALFMVIAAVLAVVLLNIYKFTIPQLLLATAVLNAVVAIYIFTLVPEFLMRFLIWIIVNTLYRLKVDGLDKVPDEGACVIVANHVSFVDALIIGGSVRRPIRFVMDHGIFKIPVLSFIFRTAKAIPIASAKVDPLLLERAYAEVDRALAEGEVVGIFPEGAITRSGEILPFRAGIERILAARAVPVVPIALRGLWGSLFSRKDTALGRARLPRRFWSHIAMVVGDPVPPAQASAAVLEAKVRELRGDWA